MARKFNLDRYTIDESTGRWYNQEVGNWVTNPNTLRRIYQATGTTPPKRERARTIKPVTARQAKLNAASKFSRFFTRGTNFSLNGHVSSRYKAMTLSKGSISYGRVEYINESGKLVKTKVNDRWAADASKGQKLSGSVCVINGTKDWVRQILITRHQLHVQAEHFRIIVGQRAQKVFQLSFRYHRFYSDGASNWKKLAPYTIKKRQKRGTGDRVLVEYGDLQKSIKIKSRSKGHTTSVYTDIVKANTSHYKKHSICYGGLHNEGKGYHGPSGTPYSRRQFLGHSTHLNPMTDSFLRRMMKQYLFDSVWLVKK